MSRMVERLAVAARDEVTWPVRKREWEWMGMGKAIVGALVGAAILPLGFVCAFLLSHVMMVMVGSIGGYAFFLSTAVAGAVAGAALVHAFEDRDR